MKTKSLRTLAFLTLSLIALAASVRAAIVTPIYAIARLSYSSGPPFSGYQFGVFDLDSPTGSLGSYQYAWTSLGPASSTALANLAYNPSDSTMFVQYGFNQYRTIATDGTIGASSLGPMNTTFGMSFDFLGSLHGASGTNWYTVNPATGSSTATNTLSGGISVYSQFGGGLAYASDGYYYFAASPQGGLQPDGRLVRIDSAGTAAVVGNFSGTDYNKTQWQALFSSTGGTYLLNSNRVYSVNLSDASLGLLGTVTGLPAEFANGFSGAVDTTFEPAAVPEPGTWAAAALLIGTAGYVRWCRRRA